jgi:toxin YoeB
MLLEFDENAFEDLRYWIKHDKKKANKILTLIQEICKTPFKGSGKPEPLKHVLSGCWSRRIDLEHRLVYKPEGEKIRILACRYHY